MENRLSFDEISEIEKKKEQDSCNITLNNLSWLLEENNNLKNNEKNYSFDLLKEEKISENFKSKKILKDKNHSYSSPINKNNFLGNKSDNLKFLKNKNEDEIQKFNIDIKEQETKDNTNDKNDFRQKNTIIYKEDGEKETVKYNDINYKNINFENEDKIFEENLDNKLDVHILNMHWNNKFFFKNNLYNSNLYNKYLPNKEIELKLLGKKREKNQNNENDKIMNLFNNIQKLYGKYIGEKGDYKMYEQEQGFYKKNITIIEEGIPTCIIYFYRNFITKIYLIMDKKILQNKKEILEVLSTLKNNIQKYKGLYPLNFKNE